jgi:hypothetical protein
MAQAPAEDGEPAVAAAQQNPLSFPRTISGDEGSVVVHTPQIDAWPNFESIEARVAIEVTPTGEDEPVYGVAEFVADTDSNLELRVVAIENLKITATSFPESDDARRERLDNIFRAIVEPKTQFVPLDVLLSYAANSYRSTYSCPTLRRMHRYPIRPDYHSIHRRFFIRVRPLCW